MKADQAISHPGRLLAVVLPIACLAMVWLNMAAIAPDAGVFSIARNGVPLADRLVLDYTFYPRLVMSLLCGAALGLAGAVFQQVLQNPLAASETLGVSAGAHLAMTAGLLIAPTLQTQNPELFALSGAFAAWFMIAAFAKARRSDPLTLILTGFVVNFALGAISSLLLLLNQEYLTSLFIWGAGSLAQGDWQSVSFLAPRVVFCAAIVALMSRALLILGFGDDAARGLGVSLKYARPLLLAVAVYLSASVVASVGVIAFVSLAAPHIARLAGAESLPARLVGAPIAGALTVLAIDQAIQLATTGQSGLLPTGAVTALVGAPILIWLLSRMPLPALEGTGRSIFLASRAKMKPATALVVALVLLTLAMLVSLFVGRGPEGLALGFDISAGVIEWRVPRVVAAAAAGLGIALAGVLVQRLFANPMASPEILGIGGGVAVGLIAALLSSAEAGPALQLAGAVGGAAAVMGILLAIGGQRGFQPERLLLIGIAITALLDGVVLLFLALGDPRSAEVLAWLGGSTYRMTMDLAVIVAAVSFGGLLATVPLVRWLDILPLGKDAAKGLGIPVRSARFAVLAVAAAISGAAALVIGPMSFIGLLAPHIANFVGLRRAGQQLVGAGLIGSALVVFADWVGRIIFAPTELPAGIIAILIGALAVALFLARPRG